MCGNVFHAQPTLMALYFFTFKYHDKESSMNILETAAVNSCCLSVV